MTNWYKICKNCALPSQPFTLYDRHY